MTTSSEGYPAPNKLPTRTPRRGGRLIVWENGRPVPIYAPPLKKEQVSELLTASLSLEYTGDRDNSGKVLSFDERFRGMTNMEVMAIRMAERAANGGEKAVTEILDRIMGKPKQSHETVGVRMTYQDFIKACEENDGEFPTGSDSDMFASGESRDLNEVIDTRWDDWMADLPDLPDDEIDEYDEDLRSLFGE